jgi:hypothetical protein
MDVRERWKQALAGVGIIATIIGLVGFASLMCDATTKATQTAGYCALLGSSLIAFSALVGIVIALSLLFNACALVDRPPVVVVVAEAEQGVTFLSHPCR